MQHRLCVWKEFFLYIAELIILQAVLYILHNTARLVRAWREQHGSTLEIDSIAKAVVWRFIYEKCEGSPI